MGPTFRHNGIVETIENVPGQQTIQERLPKDEENVGTET